MNLRRLVGGNVDQVVQTHELKVLNLLEMASCIALNVVEEMRLGIDSQDFSFKRFIIVSTSGNRPYHFLCNAVRNILLPIQLKYLAACD